MVPLVSSLCTPLALTFSVSMAEVTCCVEVAAATSACRGFSGLAADPLLLGDPLVADPQAATTSSAAVERPAAAARRGTGRREMGTACGEWLDIGRMSEKVAVAITH